MYEKKHKSSSMQSNKKGRMRSYIDKFSIILFSSLISILVLGNVQADGDPIVTPDDARSHGLESLRKHIDDHGIPLPSNLSEFVVDQDMATKMGKALFHEMAIGADGIQSCNACHFAAGADPREKNLFNPGGRRVADDSDSSINEKTLGFHGVAGAPDDTFEDTARRGSNKGPNAVAKRAMYPFIKDIGDGDNVIRQGGLVLPAGKNIHDISGSPGVKNNIFAPPNNSIDTEDPEIDEDDAVFHIGGLESRRVEPRNTPTTINAVFNFHNFWDGRANNRCNGRDPFGHTTGNSPKIFADDGTGIEEEDFDLRDASLCSQSNGPVLDATEMAYKGRMSVDLADKLLDRRALAEQKVHKQDSLLADIRFRNPVRTLRKHDRGLTMTYREMIQVAYDSRFWDSTDTVERDGRITDLTTANFSYFAGISMMLYMATLVSDDSYFDKWMATDGTESIWGFGARELRGLNLFVGKGGCVNCHSGPEMTAASVTNAQRENNLIETMRMRDLKPAMYDNGFYNIGVTPTTDDLGRGGTGPDGKPLSSSRQFAMQALGLDTMGFDISGNPIKDLQCKDSSKIPTECDILGVDDIESGLGFIDVCKDDDLDGECSTSDTLLLKRVAVDGAFKTPGLRNVALTPPYMHNGGFLTLREVVQFYNRGGNFCRTNKADLDPDIRGLGMTDKEEEDLVHFLISLTDERVRWFRAPFDGPGNQVPNGHTGNTVATTDDDLDAEADDRFITVKPTGKYGTNRLIREFLDHVGHLEYNHVKGGVCSPDIPEEEA